MKTDVRDRTKNSNGTNGSPDANHAFRFHIGSNYLFYQGPTGDNSVHAHAAFQICIALQEDIVVDDGKRQHAGTAFIIPPLLQHRQLPNPFARNIFVEPHCAFADEIRQYAASGITAAPAFLNLTEAQLHARQAHLSEQLDARLVQIMASPFSLPLSAAACEVGLSPQRLRALAQAQLGMPLARWRLWQRFRKAAQALGEGLSLVEAALDAGFSDQAHFSRQMRQMFGVTPSAVLPLLRAQSRVAT